VPHVRTSVARISYYAAPATHARLSLKESRTKLLDAANLDTKSGISGPKTTFSNAFTPGVTNPEWLNLCRMYRSEHLASSLYRHLDIPVSMSSAQKSRLKL
jgi:hypothetical protein